MRLRGRIAAIVRRLASSLPAKLAIDVPPRWTVLNEWKDGCSCQGNIDASSIRRKEDM